MNINKEYTPGPWRVMNDPHSRTLAVRDDAGVIAKIYTNRKSYNAPGDPDANARLISAAPELVEALIDQAKATAAKHYHMLKSENKLSVGNMSVFEFADQYWHDNLTVFSRAALTKAGVLKTEK